MATSPLLSSPCPALHQQPQEPPHRPPNRPPSERQQPPLQRLRPALVPVLLRQVAAASGDPVNQQWAAVPLPARNALDAHPTRKALATLATQAAAGI